MKEVWKDVKGYEGLYKVSNLGRIKSLNYRGLGKEQIIKQSLTPYGYLSVVLNKKTHLAHRIVAQAFIDNPENLPQINHKDEVKTNNSVYNLEWCTAEYNCKYSHNPEKHKKPVVAMKKDGELEFYSSVTEAAETLGITYNSITMALKGRTNMCQGRKWFYKHRIFDE